MAQYDAKLIYEFAEKLYKQAKTIVITYTAVGLVVGALLYGAYYNAGHQKDSSLFVEMVILIGLPTGIGYAVAAPKAFQLRLQAQQALCLVKIEENTRRV